MTVHNKNKGRNAHLSYPNEFPYSNTKQLHTVKPPTQNQIRFKGNVTLPPSTKKEIERC